MIQVFAVGPLVCDKADEELFSLPIQPQQMSHGLFLGDGRGCETRPDLFQDLIHSRVLHRPVNLGIKRRPPIVAGHFLHPVPIAVMAEEHDDRPAVFGEPFDEVAATDFDSLFQLFVADVKQFDGLEDTVA